MYAINRKTVDDILDVLDAADTGTPIVVIRGWTTIGGIPGMSLGYIDISPDLRILYNSYTVKSGRSPRTSTGLYIIDNGVWIPIQDAEVRDSEIILDLADLRSLRISFAPEDSE